jgi:hypothetical protein
VQRLEYAVDRLGEPRRVATEAHVHLDETAEHHQQRHRANGGVGSPPAPLAQRGWR